MKKIITALIANLGLIVANSISTACIILWMDEPKTPKSLIK